MHFRCHELLFFFLKKPSFRSDILCSSLRQFKELDLPACEIPALHVRRNPVRRASQPLSLRAPVVASLRAPPSMQRLLRFGAYFPFLSFARQLRYCAYPREPLRLPQHKPFSVARQLCNPKLNTKPPPRDRRKKERRVRTTKTSVNTKTYSASPALRLARPLRTNPHKQARTHEINPL